MFASCCNWLCMDTAEGGAAEHQAYTNSAFSGSQPPSPEHGCTACGGRFDTPAKKVRTALTTLPPDGARAVHLVTTRGRSWSRDRPLINMCSFFTLKVQNESESPPLTYPQHTCADCKKSYCSRCSAHIGPRPRLCHTCQPFYGNQLERAELMKLRVKDLREYLCLHEVPTHLCREKVGSVWSANQLRAWSQNRKFSLQSKLQTSFCSWNRNTSKQTNSKNF